jgi:hypothetical protein
MTSTSSIVASRFVHDEERLKGGLKTSVQRGCHHPAASTTSTVEDLEGDS